MTRILFLLIAATSLVRAELSFDRDVRPVLAAACLQCHGPDAATRKAGLRLDTREGAFALLESGKRAVVPGKPEASELLARLDHSIYPDADERMPPAESGKTVSAAQRQLLRRWIEQGATWQEHWSSRPLQTVNIPATKTDWARNPVDAFIERGHHARDLKPAPEADRLTLIRRLHYDLIGLPPTPEQVAAFVADPSPYAVERLVDRLLASPHYGERWGRHWLDVVKYADSHGYDKDKPRPHAWPYRDYVIRAFNEDKAYPDFVREQLAADVFAPDDPGAIAALGFIAAGPWDFIGHSEVPESKIDGKVARNLDRDDMVCNTLNTFTSTTIQCARCHNHKFDPITMEHYYSLQAVFASIDRANRTIDADPAITQQRREFQAALKRLDAKLKELEPAAANKSRYPPEHGWHSQMVTRPDIEKWVQVDLGKAQPIEQIVLRACHDDFGGIGAGFGFPLRFRVEVSNDAAFEQGVVVVQDQDTDLPNPKLEPHIIRSRQRARHLRVTATKLFHRVDRHMVAFAELEVRDTAGTNLAAGKPVRSLDSIQAPNRWRRSNLTDGKFPVANKAKTPPSPEQKSNQTLREQTQKERRQIETKLAALPPAQRVYVGTVHQGNGNFRGRAGLGPREIRILHRGEVTQPGAAVQPGTVPLLPGVDWQFDLPANHDESARRQALAEWIVHDDHPLTWRSIVNRVWQHHFGRGLVDSPNDFGRMGQTPSHPELLDWLAAGFRDDPSFKRLHRLLVTSSTYRQASRHHAAFAKRDGDNAYLWRMNRRRLDAESLRDSVLAVSGKLDPRMGGPGYYLFKLEQTANSPHYEYHKHDPEDAASHRRAVYRFVVRSQPDPFMTTLDCADSSQSTPKRDETLTALQALSLLNNKFNVAMARHFAARVEREVEGLPAQVERAYQLATGRVPDAERLAELTAYARAHGLPNLCRLLFNLNEFLYLD